MSAIINAAVCSNMGKVRKNNEDNFYFNGLYMDESQRNGGGTFKHSSDDPIQIYAVCDGMGGEEGGEDASLSAVRALEQYARTTRKADGTEQLKELLQQISDTIEDNAREKGFHSGTTIAMAVICEDKVRIIHVGDSRVYCLENGKLSRKTVDHSEVQRMFSMGLITAEEMNTHPKRHVITQFLGMSRSSAPVAPTISDREQIRAGQRYLLCSDGLTDMVRDHDIEKILASAANAEDAVKQLTIAALQNGGKDNVTSICLFAEYNKKRESTLSPEKLKKKRTISICGMMLSGIIVAASLFLLFRGMT